MSNGDHHSVLSLGLLLFSLLIILCLLLQYHIAHIWNLKFIPEAACTLFVGMCVSGILRFFGEYFNFNDGPIEEILNFNASMFFFALLPPILFNSGYHLKRELFYSNFGGVLGLALLGTIISTAIVCAGLFYLGEYNYMSIKLSLQECIAFSALISSTDPVSTLSAFAHLKVEPTLFYLVFGESILNDAICVTLFRIASNLIGKKLQPLIALHAIGNFFLVFTLSTLIGYVFGMISAFIFKQVNFKHHRIVVVAIFLTIVYIPFLLSEALQLSGIVTILFTGISARRYINKNISEKAKKISSFLFLLLSHMSETFVFLTLGLSVFTQTKMRSVHVDFIFYTFLLCLVSRAIHVYPILILTNLYRRWAPSTNRISIGDIEAGNKQDKTKDVITSGMMHVIFFSGLRGAVAYSCAAIFPDQNGSRELIICTTMAIILISMFVQGMLIIPVINLTGVKTGYSTQPQPLSIESNQEDATSIQPVLSPLHIEERYIYPLVLKARCFSPSTRKYMIDSYGVVEENGINHQTSGLLSSSSGGGSYHSKSGDEDE